MVYYNEIHKGKAAWLRELISMGLIARGDVDERDIRDIAPRELVGYTQCHFFAGIGIWSYALRNAGWPDDKPCWTGSCPCQSFSAAGKRKGFDDERHLWPSWFWLIRICRPDVVFGEQVASKDAEPWLDLVSADMEGEDYAVGALDLCAAGFGAPEIRQRLFWVAESNRGSREEPKRVLDHANGCGEIERLGESPCEQDDAATAGGLHPEYGGTGSDGGVDNTAEVGQQQEPVRSRSDGAGLADERGPVNGFWRDADWVLRRRPKGDGADWCPTQPSSLEMADGAPARMVFGCDTFGFPLEKDAPARALRLEGYGDGIVSTVAQGFIEAYIVRRNG